MLHEDYGRRAGLRAGIPKFCKMTVGAAYKLNWQLNPKTFGQRLEHESDLKSRLPNRHCDLHGVDLRPNIQDAGKPYPELESLFLKSNSHELESSGWKWSFFF